MVRRGQATDLSVQSPGVAQHNSRRGLCLSLHHGCIRGVLRNQVYGIELAPLFARLGTPGCTLDIVQEPTLFRRVWAYGLVSRDRFEDGALFTVKIEPRLQIDVSYQNKKTVGTPLVTLSADFGSE